MFDPVDPKQSFPKLEEETLKYWTANKIFEKSVENRPKQDEFIFYDGPPFATGLPHYGHLLAGTMKDVVPRYWTMRGKRVERRWGWDCHGLPIENLVEKELGLSGKKDIEEKHGVGEFCEECRSSVLKYTGEWKKTVDRTARWVDMEDHYKTMDLSYMESIWWVFAQLWEKELVQAETHQAREVVRSNNQMPFVLGSSDNIRRTLGIGEEMLVTSTHMGLQVDQYPGYAFGDLNFGGTNTTEWLIGYAPHLRQNQFIVIGKKNHKKIGSANNKAGLESLLRAKISENNEEESLLAIIEDAPPSDDQGIAIAEEDLDQDGVADLTIEDATRPIQPAPQNIRVQATDSHSGKSLGSVSRIDQQRGFSSTNQIDALPQSSQNPVNSVINSVFVEYSQRHGAPPIVARSDTYFTDRYMISLRDPLYVEISRGGQTPRYKVYYRRTVYNPYERAQEIVSENVLTGGRDGWTTSLKEVDRLVRQEVLHA